jgi:hypothetical protein
MQLGGSGGTSSATTTTTHSSTHAATSTATHSASATTSNATTNTVTVASSSSGPSCSAAPSPGEPNDSEQDAYDLGNITDCDSTGGSLSGLLETPSAVDWYRYHGQSTVSFCIVDPTRSVTSSDAIRVCKYAVCDNQQSTTITCPQGTTSDTSPEGRDGCCGSGGFTMKVSCGGAFTPNTSTVFIRIDQAASNCVTYSMMYHY